MAECTETPFSIPEYLSSICTTGLLPHIMTGCLLQIVRHHFSDADNIVQESLRSRVWSPATADSNILIDVSYDWSPENVQQRPAVLLRRGQLKTSKVSIGNVFHGAPDLDGYAEDKMMVAFQGSTVLFCVANTGTEAEQLGAEVAYELMEFSQIIRQQLGLMSFDLFDIGQVSHLQESSTHFAVPVSVAYAYSHGWTVLRQRPIWMTFALDMRPQVGGGN